MTLSFREQAAIAFATASNADGWLQDEFESAPATAQGLADECCKAWGHDGAEVVSPKERLVASCKRCGFTPGIPEQAEDE